MTTPPQAAAPEKHGALGRLVRDTETLAANWEREAFAAAAGDDLAKVFSLDTALDLMSRPGLPASCFRLFRDGAPVPQEEFEVRRGRPGPGREATVDVDALRRAHDAGATVIFEEVRTLVPAVDSLAADLAEELGFRIYCAAFLTPADTAGIWPHYDLASGLLCQVHGSKSWHVGEPEQRWPTVPCGASRPEFTPTLRTVLQPGQTLYIPRGHPHSGAATEEPSLHLSFAIMPFTWKDLLVRHLETSVEHDPLREMLPLGHGGTPAEALLGEAFGRLPRVDPPLR